MANKSQRPRNLGTIAAWVLLVALALLFPSIVQVDQRGDFITRRTADVAVLFWLIASVALLTRQREFARLTWALACAAFVIHVVSAFHLWHDWSHDCAFEHVEVESGYGQGIFVSYAFALIWIGDVLWWRFDPSSYDHRPVWLDRTLHLSFAFIVFNGTVVYETGFIRWLGLGGFVVLAVLLVGRLTRSDEPEPTSD